MTHVTTFPRSATRTNPGAKWLRLAVLGMVGGLLPYLAGGFLLDDNFHLERLTRGQGLTFAIDTAGHQMTWWVWDEPVRIVYCRPVVVLSWWLDRLLWGHGAFGYHLTNLLLHLFNAFALQRLARRMGLGQRGAYAAALLWGSSVHVAPAVGWISGRTEILAMTFMLAAAHALFAWRRNGQRRWLAMAVAAVGAGCLCKESAVVAPILVLLASRFADGTRAGELHHRPRLLQTVTLAAPSVIYLTLRSCYFEVPEASSAYFQPVHGLGDAARMAIKALTYGSGALFGLPVLPLASESALADHPWLAGIAFIVIGLGLLLLWKTAGARATVVVVAWVVVALAPYAPLMATSLYLHVPMCGVSLLIAHAWERSGSRLVHAWVATLVAMGIAGHVLLGVFIAQATDAMDEAADQAAAAFDRREGDLVLIDAPVWAYSLPACLRLRHGDDDFETIFLTFSPGILPDASGTVVWEGSHTLRIDRVGEPMFASHVERFLLFGADPRAAHAGLPASIAAVAPGPPGSSSLLVELSPRGESAVLMRFRGWRLEPLASPSQTADRPDRGVQTGERQDHRQGKRPRRDAGEQ